MKEKLVKFIKENKIKVVISVVVVVLLASLGTAYGLGAFKTPEPEKGSKTVEVKQDKKPSAKEDKKNDNKKHDDKKSNTNETSTSDAKADEPKNTENTTVAPTENNSTISTATNNTTSKNGCHTVYREAVTHVVHHDAEYQSVYVVDTHAHDETTYTLVYYVQFSNGEKWYHDGSANFAEKVVDYALVNGLSYSTGAENQPNTVHYDEVGHYENQVVRGAYDETVIDSPAHSEEVCD